MVLTEVIEQAAVIDNLGGDNDLRRKRTHKCGRCSRWEQVLLGRQHIAHVNILVFIIRIRVFPDDDFCEEFFVGNDDDG